MNIKKMLDSIQFKILAYLALFSVSILLIFWLSENVFLSVFYERYQIKNIKTIANEIYNTSDDLEDVLSDIVYNNNVCIQYETKEGLVKDYNTLSVGCILGRNNMQVNEYKTDIKNSNEDIKGIKIVNPEYESKAILYGIKSGKGYVYVFTTLENVDKASNVINSQLIYIAFIIILLSIFIAYLLSKKISKPIIKISNQTKQLAKGDYKVIFYKNGISEVDQLSENLEHLKCEFSKTDEYRRDLMANVSHDLKTPLTMIKAYAEMVKDISYKDEEKRNEHLDIIIDETDRLNILVNDILTLSKIQQNEDELNIEEYDLKPEIDKILKKYTIIKETEDYNFICKCPKKVMIKADKNKINQVIYNLVNNAMNYTGKDNKVNINVIDNNNYYLVEIKDSGKGISKEDLPYIWDRYYKKDKNHKRNVVGTGLGLSIVKNILVKHNFDYGVNSQINKGTTFYFKINK